jgi:arachidonate 15-lipoxygenase
MDNVNRLPHYPYRDDGLLLWEAIQAYVSSYLAIYYKTPADITADFELQAWAADLVTNGHVQGLSPSFSSLATLTDVVTTVIFTCSAVHSAVNYPQWDYMGFVPNMPLAGYADYRQQLLHPFDDAAYMRLLPPNQPAIQQVAVMHFLAGYHFDRLGYYEDKFEDAPAQAANESFRRRLDDVERTIDYNNTKRQVAYPYLKPSLVLNSISI